MSTGSATAGTPNSASSAPPAPTIVATESWSATCAAAELKPTVPAGDCDSTRYATDEKPSPIPRPATIQNGTASQPMPHVGATRSMPAAPPEPVPTAPRPRLMIAVPVLMVLAALPFLLFGALFVAAPVAGIAQEVLASPNMQAAGATEQLVVSAVRVLGGVILGVALLYLVFGFLAFAGRNWARIITAVLTGGFVLLLVAGLVVSGGAIDTITLASVLLVLILGAVAILFSPGANAWYAARR